MASRRMVFLALLLALPLLAFGQDQQGGSLVPFGGGLFRVGESLDVAIANKAGDVSGRVNDIIIDGNGEFRFVVASISTGAQQGEYLIPSAQVTYDSRAGRFRLDLSAAQVAGLMRLEGGMVPAGLDGRTSGTAPGIATAPDEPEPTGRIREYGARPAHSGAPSIATAPDEPEPTGTTLRSQSLSRRYVSVVSLLGSEFTNLQGADLGRVESVVLNLPQTRVEYMAVSTFGGLGVGDRYYAVPMRVLIEAEPTLGQVVLNIPEQRLRSARGFLPGGAWPRSVEGSFGGLAVQSFGVLDTGPDD